MLDETRIATIEAAIAAEEAERMDWTNQSIYDAVGGNYGELAQYLKARRAQGREGEAVAVAEAQVAAQAPPSLREQLDAARLSWSHASGRLAQLRAQAERFMLGADEETEMLRLEARIARLQPVLERLRHEVDTERETTDVESFRQTWLTLVESKRQGYEALVQAQVAMWQALLALEQRHLAQEQAIDHLPPRLARKLHDQFLPDWGTIKKRMVGTMVNSMAWDLLLTHPGPPRVARADVVMDNDPGTKAIPVRLLPNMMEGRL